MASSSPRATVFVDCCSDQTQAGCAASNSASPIQRNSSPTSTPGLLHGPAGRQAQVSPPDRCVAVHVTAVLGMDSCSGRRSRSQSSALQRRQAAMEHLRTGEHCCQPPRTERRCTSPSLPQRERRGRSSMKRIASHRWSPHADRSLARGRDLPSRVRLDPLGLRGPSQTTSRNW